MCNKFIGSMLGTQHRENTEPMRESEKRKRKFTVWTKTILTHKNTWERPYCITRNVPKRARQIVPNSGMIRTCRRVIGCAITTQDCPCKRLNDTPPQSWSWSTSKVLLQLSIESTNCFENFEMWLQIRLL